MSTMLDYRTEAGGEPTTLMLGYGHMPEPAMVPGAREVAKAVRAAA